MSSPVFCPFQNLSEVYGAVVLQKKHLSHIVLQIARFVFPAGRHQRRFGYVAADVALVFGEAQRVKICHDILHQPGVFSAIRICRCSVKIRPKWYMPPTDRCRRLTIRRAFQSCCALPRSICRPVLPQRGGLGADVVCGQPDCRFSYCCFPKK